MKQKLFIPAMSLTVILIAVIICNTLVYPHITGNLSFEYLAYNYIPLFLLSGLIFAITNRAVLSSFIAGTAAIALVAISNAKFSVLRVPLIPSDFYLLRQVIDSPKLYLKYVNHSAYYCIALFLIVSGVIFKLEPRQLKVTWLTLFSRLILASATIAFFLSITSPGSLVANIYKSSSLKYSSWLPRDSVENCGFFYTLIRMSRGLTITIPEHFGDAALIEKIADSSPAARTSPPPVLPDIVVVQSEAFYDLRQHYLTIDKPAYAEYDKTATGAAVSGNLGVQTIGGNTVKTEFSFLTGIENSLLPSGFDYPYRFLVTKKLWSIAWYLKSLGYKTIAIHPHTRTFWNRHVALPYLGFDEFFDGEYFTDNQNEGPYVSDRAVADRILTLRSHLRSPLFIFAVTMENHGPWDTKRVDNARKFVIKGNIQPNDQEKLARYLHHVVNAGAMVSHLTQKMEQDRRPCLLAFYGDHAPGFQDIFTAAGLRPGKSITETPFFIWRNFGLPGHVSHDIGANFLASEILDQAGINDDPYFRANAYIRRADGGHIKGLEGCNEIDRSYAQLLYNNLAGKLSGVRFTAKNDIRGELDRSTKLGLRISDYGPKVIKSGKGANIQADGSTAIWLTAKDLKPEDIIFVNNQPIDSGVSADKSAISATLPMDYYKKSGTINICIEDSVNLIKSNTVQITVN